MKKSHNERKSMRGWDYYKNQPLKSILVHVPEEVYGVLKDEAKTELRSLEKTVRKVLTDYAKKRRL